jgi:copper chaperone CopZ
METTVFTVAALVDQRHALDLGNSLLAISGLAHLDVDLTAHTISIQFDSAYVNRDMLQACIEGTGYPVTSGDAA